MSAAKNSKGLGKGLDLLIPDFPGLEEEMDFNEDDVIYVPLSKIEPNKNQPRKKFNNETLEELAASIKQHGVIQPIIVSERADYYEIIAGERRWRAARKAGLKKMPVLVREYSEQEINEISLIENIQREDLNPIEEAAALAKLINDYKVTQEELSKRLGKNRSTLANTMRLLKLPGEVQEMVANGDISEGHARALLSLTEEFVQKNIAKEIVKKQLSVRQTEELVKNSAAKKKKAQPKKKIVNDLFYKDIESKMTEALGTKVAIKQKSKGQGLIEISYFSEEELNEIYKAISKIK